MLCWALFQVNFATVSKKINFQQPQNTTSSRRLPRETQNIKIPQFPKFTAESRVEWKETLFFSRTFPVYEQFYIVFIDVNHLLKNMHLLLPHPLLARTGHLYAVTVCCCPAVWLDYEQPLPPKHCESKPDGSWSWIVHWTVALDYWWHHESDDY